jgi:hypothetical protein
MAQAEVEARRRALGEETYRVRTQTTRGQVTGESLPTSGTQQQSKTPTAPKGSVGRPRGITKAGNAAGQQALP